MALFET
jgi:hypothetical protein